MLTAQEREEIQLRLLGLLYRPLEEGGFAWVLTAHGTHIVRCAGEEERGAYHRVVVLTCELCGHQARIAMGEPWYETPDEYLRRWAYISFHVQQCRRIV